MSWMREHLLLTAGLVTNFTSEIVGAFLVLSLLILIVDVIVWSHLHAFTLNLYQSDILDSKRNQVMAGLSLIMIAVPWTRVWFTILKFW
jgi:hypothetical protein